ncbi:MAG: UDP-N-acetylglucosamine 2-epimerase (non-hydrolyzing) [Firmicutes bacterium]|nr:UDP-N-acetylglucosamine 2-epimerase (non-hydrolyzing) [Bacillota bacterium]
MTSPLQVMTVFGTRPDAVKMAPVVLELQRYEPHVQVRVVVTGQHREMLDQVLQVFRITPHHDLNIMQHGQTLTQITVRVLEGLDALLREQKPHVLLAQGDTTTTFVAALAAFYHQVAFGHVEAGLRTYHKYNPFPEEMNRRLAGAIADFHFAPTPKARENLLREGVNPESIWVTGNTGIDALLMVAEKPYPMTDPLLQQAMASPLRTVLLTAHRRENWGEPLWRICLAVRQLVERFEDIQVVFPMHRNPLVRQTATEVLGGVDRVILTDPPEYAPFVKLMQHSTLILTDSGGVQEEAPSLGKPVLVLRETTERPEGVEAGTARLIGTDTERIVEEASRLLSDEDAYGQMARAVNPYGDGKAAQRIRQVLFEHFGVSA